MMSYDFETIVRMYYYYADICDHYLYLITEVRSLTDEEVHEWISALWVRDAYTKALKNF